MGTRRLPGTRLPPGRPGLVVNGVATLSVPTGRMVLFRMVGAARTAEGVVDLVDADRRVVLP